MLTPEPHRKRVRHFDVPGHVHELTFSSYGRLPLLAGGHHNALLARSIDAAVARCRFNLVGFIFMQEHVHLLVFPREASCAISGLLYAIKRPVAYRIKLLMESQRDPRLADLLVWERPGKQTFRFWQEGPGYDRNLMNRAAVTEALQYAHANPVRRGLCETPGQWKWSSWHHYHSVGHIDPDLPGVHGLPTA
jgi:putative transposase